jgi:putative ABC transport system ATP-binding protein
MTACGANADRIATRPGMLHAMLTLRALARRFPGPPPRPLFAGVDLDLGAGEFVAIIGDSGVGKSTLLHCIAGLDHPDDGAIVVDGVDLASLDDDGATLLRRQKLGFVFQAFHILPWLDLAANVALPLGLLGTGAVESRRQAFAMLSAVGLGDRAASFPRELSGGELQRVAIARALVHSPRLLLADEPTGNLDPDNAARVLDLLATQVRSRGAACVLVTHSHRAAAAADRVLRLSADGLTPAA